MGKSKVLASTESAKYRKQKQDHVSKRMTPAADEFKRRSLEILNEHTALSKQKAPADGPFNSPEGFLKRECYTLIQKYISRGGHQLIKHLSGYENRQRGQPEYLENQFYWGLLAIDFNVDIIGQSNISLYSLQMLYAHQHRVPPEYLIGFIYQSGSRDKLRTKLRENGREDDFELTRRRGKALWDD